MKKKISTLGITLLMMLSLAPATEASPALDSLNAKQKSIATIAMFTANGDLGSLKVALNEGLESGLTVNEIKEVLVQLYAYCGFPRSLNAINTFMVVMDERKAKGIQDEFGSAGKAMPADINKNEYGMLVRQKLLGRKTEATPAGYQLFTPVIDDFLTTLTRSLPPLNYLTRDNESVGGR